MFHVYVLHSVLYDKIYIGYSSNLGVRFIYHNQGPSKGWTVRYRPWALIWIEKFETKRKAMRRGRELKSARGRRWIWEEVVQSCWQIVKQICLALRIRVKNLPELLFQKSDFVESEFFELADAFLSILANSTLSKVQKFRSFYKLKTSGFGSFPLLYPVLFSFENRRIFQYPFPAPINLIGSVCLLLRGSRRCSTIPEVSRLILLIK